MKQISIHDNKTVFNKNYELAIEKFWIDRCN